MTAEKLALFGGPKAISRPFQPYNSIGDDEVEAARLVIESGNLSQFLGCWGTDFYGGPKVQEFEKQCAEYFGVNYAITVNSWTSGLIAAIGAVGIEPGDEVIVPSWTMCACATAILHWNGIPIFADINPETYCLDPASVEVNVTSHTRAIMAVDIFGQSADMDCLLKIAEKYNLKVISDTAQAPGAFYKGKPAGTLAHVGGYSLNYHKHIHTGEGGVLVTNDKLTAERLRLIRNHAEAVVYEMGVLDLSNMLGYNFRLGEIECAIGIEQLKKLEGLVGSRQYAASKITDALIELAGLKTPAVQSDSTHAYYVYPMQLDVKGLGVSRARIIEALEAEGVMGLMAGYANLHLLPVYQRKTAYGAKGFPWSSDICRRNVSYEKGICPVAEALHDSTFLGLEMCRFRMDDSEIEAIVRAFRKVWANIESLKCW